MVGDGEGTEEEEGGDRHPPPPLGPLQLFIRGCAYGVVVSPRVFIFVVAVLVFSDHCYVMSVAYAMVNHIFRPYI